MGKKCCVRGCAQVEEGELRHLWSFPFCSKTLSKGYAAKQKRRRIWFRNLKIEYEEDNKKDLRVCNLHFVFGKQKILLHFFKLILNSYLYFFLVLLFRYTLYK